MNPPRDWGYAILGLWLLSVSAAWTGWLIQDGWTYWVVLSAALGALGGFSLAAAWMPTEGAAAPPPDQWLGPVPVYSKRDLVIGAMQLVFGISAWLTATTLAGWVAAVAVVVGLGMQVLGVGALLSGVQPKDRE